MSNINLSKKNTVEALLDEGFSCISTCDYRRALQIAAKLKKFRHSSCFEIAALALAGTGKQIRAIAVLKEGLVKAPGVWRMWQLLGNFESDQLHYVRALTAYRRALRCPHVDQSSVFFNWTVVLQRQGKITAALAQLKKVKSRTLDSRVVATKLELLNSLHRYQQSIKLARTVLEKCAAARCRDGELTIKARIRTAYAEALWKQNKGRTEALNQLWKSVQLDGHNLLTMRLVREIEGKSSLRNRAFHLLFEGQWPHPFRGETRRPGFFINYLVSAETSEEAISYAKRFEPPKVRASLQVVESKVKKRPPGQLKGVYTRSSSCFFNRVDEK